jgi:hypothetical protein
MGKVFAELDNGPSHAARRLPLVMRLHDLRDKTPFSSGSVFGLHRNSSQTRTFTTVSYSMMEDEERFTDSKTRLMGDEDEIQSALDKRRPRSWRKIAAGLIALLAYTAFVFLATRNIYSHGDWPLQDCEWQPSRITSAV